MIHFLTVTLNTKFKHVCPMVVKCFLRPDGNIENVHMMRGRVITTYIDNANVFFHPQGVLNGLVRDAQ